MLKMFFWRISFQTVSLGGADFLYEPLLLFALKFVLRYRWYYCHFFRVPFGVRSSIVDELAIDFGVSSSFETDMSVVDQIRCQEEM